MALLDHDVPGAGRSAPPRPDPSVRERALKRLAAKRRFHVEMVIAAVATCLLILIWALSEYHNAGGWPTQGFSQSSGIHDVWNYWIVYPVIGIALVVGGRAWSVYGNKAPTEGEIEREIDRETGRR